MKPRAERKPAYLAWIRTLVCRIPGCAGQPEAAHVRQASGGGMGLKPSDRWCVPLCHLHHREQHQLGHAAFDAKHRVDLRAYAIYLAESSGFWL